MASVDNELNEKNLKVLIEASRKIRNRELKSMNEVEMWVWSHPDYSPTDHDISYGIAHLHTLKYYFL
jgi:hypothetical protein